jgi:hypothetical protein
MAKKKKATKAARRAEHRRRGESVGPERSRVKDAARVPAVEESILEEARVVREKKHGPESKELIVAIGRARALKLDAAGVPRGPRGKPRTREHSSSAYHKARQGRHGEHHGT